MHELPGSSDVASCSVSNPVAEESVPREEAPELESSSSTPSEEPVLGPTELPTSTSVVITGKRVTVFPEVVEVARIGGGSGQPTSKAAARLQTPRRNVMTPGEHTGSPALRPHDFQPPARSKNSAPIRLRAREVERL